MDIDDASTDEARNIAQAIYDAEYTDPSKLVFISQTDRTDGYDSGAWRSLHRDFGHGIHLHHDL